MLYPLEELKQFRQNLEQELGQAAEGQANSLAFAKNPIPTKPLLQEDQIFQVMMMGGSHLESALVKNIYGVIRILHVLDEDLPLLETKEKVCEIFAKHLNPNVDIVCLNFAYPLQAFIREDCLDGVLIRGTKQHSFINLIGQNVGQTLEKYIFDKFQRKITVTVCNDTTALALASLGYSENFGPEETMVGVIGTGFNFGFFDNKETFINLESGNFDKFNPTTTGRIIDSESSNPKRQLLEKEVGGAYLSWHYNLLAQELGLDITLGDSKEVSQLAAKNTPAGYLAQKILQRSASLVAMHIAAIYLYQKSKLGSAEDFKMLALLEGSLYWKGHNYRQYVDEYIGFLGIDRNNLTIVGIERMGIIGASKLAIR